MSWAHELVEPVTAHDAHVHEIVEVLAHGRTAVQSWQIVRLGAFGRAMVIDGRVQSTEADEAIYHEALLLPAAAYAGTPARVLCLGGANGGMLHRILALPGVRSVLQLDVDAELYRASRTHLPHMHRGAPDDPRATLRFGDPRALLDEHPGPFDLVLADLPDSVPGSHVPGMFTREFYGQVRARLADGGVFATQAGAATPVAPEFPAGVLRTVAAVFRHAVAYTASVPAFGVPWAFVLASDTVPAPGVPEGACAVAAVASTYDAETHSHMFALPRAWRSALDGRGRIGTDADPLYES